MNIDSSDIFISYSHHDGDEFARYLQKKLLNRGLRVWLDDSALGVGDELYENIVKAIRRSGIYVAIVSPRFCDENKWAFKEFLEAIDEEAQRYKNEKQKKFILPIRHDPFGKLDQALNKNTILSKYLEGKVYLSTDDKSIENVEQKILEYSGTIEDFLLPLPNTNVEISRFPVTNLEYKRFINAGGYTNKGLEHWWSDKGRDYWYSYATRNEHKYLWQIRTEDAPIDRNLSATNLLYNRFNQPVTGVSYFEAQAYCNWLNAVIISDPKSIIRMPTQEEWMNIYTNQDKTSYPWGMEPPSSNYANLIDERENHNQKEINLKQLAKINTPSILGEKPNGIAQSGHQDLCGNVWEWVNDFASSKEIKDFADSKKTEDLSPEAKNEVDYDLGNRGKIMGNCCFDPPSRVQAIPIDYRYPGYRHHVIGFRVAKQFIG